MINYQKNNTISKPLIEMLDEYAINYANENEKVDLINQYLTNPKEMSKAHQLGHVTGSAWIVNNNKDMALMTHHAKLDMWLQLGGHIEDNEHIIESAYREAREESGLESIKILSEDIFDIDIHLIPAKAEQEAHYHYDIRFLFEADKSEKLIISKESKNLMWIKLEDILDYNNNESITRMIKKYNKV